MNQLLQIGISACGNWQPEGEQIAFSFSREGDKFRIDSHSPAALRLTRVS